MAQSLTRASFELHQIEPILSWAGTSGVDVDGLLHRLGIDPDLSLIHISEPTRPY